jgi:4-amino-4-deoxy-L-arabinose transferase-like glycosyltransferase
MKFKNYQYQLIIAVVGTLFFISFIGRLTLFDWDEINFAESAREMILTHDYLTVRAYFEPFWEKPPLFIWFQVLSMKTFGINEFAARFPNTVCGVLTLLILFNIGKSLYDKRFGLIWVMTYGCSLLPFFYFKTGIIDPWFNLLIFLSFYFWVKGQGASILKKEALYIVLSAVSLGLAVLTKGPASIIIFGLSVSILFLLNKFRLNLHWKNCLLFITALIFTGGFWFILEILTGHYKTVIDFIVYQVRLFRTEDAGHGGFPFYHFIVLLFGVFPASIFAIQGHKYVGEQGLRKSIHTSMIVLLWVVLILFSIVKTKIVHYSSLCYFPLSYLAAYSVGRIIQNNLNIRSWQKILICITGLTLALIVILLPVIARFKQELIIHGIVTNRFSIGNLQADPGWGWFHSLISLLILSGIYIFLFYKNQVIRLISLFIGTMLFTYTAIIFITPGAERISQHAAIEFVKEVSDKDTYLHSFYKSFAPWYYGKRPVPISSLSNDEKWLTTGDIDKDVYFMARNYDKESIQNKYPELKFLYEKNGYVFFIRYTSLHKNILNDRQK